jgi:CRP-like cAMP-binding protein
MTFKQLKHGDTLSAEGIYLLKEGRIKIYQTPPEGDVITLDVLDPGEFFGAVNWENNDAHLNVTAEALTETVVGVVPVKNFQYFLKRKPHLAMPPQRTLGSLIKKHLRWRSAESENYNLVTSCQKPRQGMTNPFLNIAFRSPASRLALLLQNCAETPERGGTTIGHGSKRVPHKLSTKRLAQLIGSSVEKMEALLNQFKQHGIIKKRFRRIQILDPWQLKKIANARMASLPPKTVENQENTETYEQEEPLFADRPADGR